MKNRILGYLCLPLLLTVSSLHAQTLGDTLLIITDRDCCPSLTSYEVHLSPLATARYYEGRKSTKDLKRVMPNVKVLVCTNPDAYAKNKYDISGLNQLTTIIFASNGLSGCKEIRLSKSVMDRSSLEIILLDGLTINPKQLKLLQSKSGIKITTY